LYTAHVLSMNFSVLLKYEKLQDKSDPLRFELKRINRDN